MCCIFSRVNGFVETNRGLDLPLQLCVITLTLSHPAAALAQERSTIFGTFRANLAVVDNARDDVLDDMGFQLAGSVGRPLATDFAGSLSLL